MPNTVVTSCSASGWEKYGRRFVETYTQFWPKHIALHVVTEDPLLNMSLVQSASPKVFYWSLDRSATWRSFKAQNAERGWVSGDSLTPRPAGIAPRWREDRGYNFRYDAYKFSKKVFAIELIAEHLKGGKLFWIDADVLTFAPVPDDLLDRMLPSDHTISYLARVGYHSECGFVGYNLDQHNAVRFIKTFAALYDSEAVFELAEWHDSWVFDWLRGKLLPDCYSIPHKSKGHPFINSELGKYMDHLKGKRKDKGRSALVEQVANGKIPYWQGARR